MLTHIEDIYFWTFVPGIVKYTEMYVRKSYLYLADTYFSALFSQIQMSYYEMLRIRETIDAVDSSMDLVEL